MRHASSTRIQTLVGEIRKQWRRRALLQGAALTLLTLLFFASVALILFFRFEATVLTLVVVGVVGAVAVLGVLGLFVIRPGLRRLSDRDVALFIEEKIPDLEDRLNSAIEIGGDAGLRQEHDALIAHLLADATARARSVSLATVVDRQKERLLAGGAAAALLLFLLFGYPALSELRLAFTGTTLADLAVGAPPALTVSPGSVEIERGASQEIIVTLREATDRPLTLHYKEGEGAWQEAPMTPAVDAPTFLHELYDIQAPVQYFVTLDDLRTDPFDITLYEFPAVTRIDQRYTYPSYTGLPARTEEDMGDIRGLKGSTVTLTIAATGAIETGEVVLGGGARVPLRPLGDGRFQAALRLDEPGTYTVHLADAAGKENKFPEEYLITPEEDAPPNIALDDPGRDVRANAIEEVLLAVTVTDDYGVRDVNLRYSINGDEEQSIALAAPNGPRETEVTGEHLFFLEDFALAPGDVISYYVEAADGLRTETPEATDMYFIEVIPFDQQYRQQANMGGQQGGQASPIVLSQQQIIAATWKLHRERDDLDKPDFDETLSALAQAQANLKANIEERIANTAFSVELQSSEEGQQIVAHLRQATDAMADAVVELRAERLREALTPERRALNHLLKADAFNQERQVAMNQQGGSGGGATEERMTELMDLELDISKDKYELQNQQSQGGGGNPALDETLQRLQELARRQQNLAQQSQREMEGEDKKRQVERLQRDQDELRRQAESLAQNLRRSQQGQAQQGRQMEQGLERAIDRMDEAEEALRDGDAQQAMARQQQALNELNRLTEDLGRQANSSTREQLERLAQDFEGLRDRERRLGQNLDETRQRGTEGGLTTDDLAPLKEQRRALRDDLDRLDAGAEALEERLRDADPNLARNLRSLRQGLRREALDDMMRDSEQAITQGWLDYADRLEDEIEAGLERAETQMRALASQRGETDDERLAQSLDDIRDLQRQFEQMRSPSAQGQPSPDGQPSQQGQPNPDGQPGQQGQPGQGQQGQSGNPNQPNPDGQAGNSGQGRAERAQSARMQRQVEQAQETLRRLQNELEGNPEAARQLNNLQSSLARLSNAGTRLEGDGAKAFFDNRIFAPLSQLEATLAAELDRLAMDRKLYGARRGDVPAEYRALVEKYYEALSKSN